MTSAQVATPVTLKSVLYLTDFSPSSKIALPFAISLTREYAGSLEVLHVLSPAIPESCPDAVKADEELAEAEMKKIRSQTTGIACETTMARGIGLWEAIDRAILEHHIDLIVAGTHGRTGLPKLLLGSVAEEVFLRSPVPVLTVGPHVRNNMTNWARFDRVLFATDFGSGSETTAAYAFSLAQENRAHLILLHVMRGNEARDSADVNAFEASVARTMDRLYQIAPRDAALYHPREVLVEYGEAADHIVRVARERGADLIVLGVPDAPGHLGAATHLERTTAYEVVLHAACPVLTVRHRDIAKPAAERTSQ